MNLRQGVYMKYRSAFSAILLAGLSAPVWSAAEVEVKWEDPDSYTDVKPANESRGGFQKRTFNALEEYFAELAESLPDGQTWSVTVTNLDLAGQVWPSSFVGFGSSAGTDIRLIKEIDIPRIAFSYTLTDASGATIKSADVKLKDMGFMDGLARKRHRDNLAYEKEMIREWFNEEMTDVVVKQ